MPMLKRLGLIVFLAFLALLISVAANLSRFTGIYQSRAETLVSACTERFPLAGAEDVVSLPGKGIFVSATDRGNRIEGFRDGIYWIPNGGAPVLASKDAPPLFHPHGLSLLREDGRVLLYAVSHKGALYAEGSRADDHSVEVFAVGDGGTLRHLRTLTHPLMRSPNDLAVLSEDRFFLTNDWRFLGGVMRQLEQFLALPISDVIFFDRGEARIADKFLNYPNGIALSSDQKTLWVNEVRGRSIRRYEVDSATGLIARQGQIPLATVPDNVTYTPQGDLLIAGIPEAFRFQRHAQGEAKTAPAQILKVTPETGRVETVFYTDGGVINGATVGRAHDGHLFIGTAYGKTLLKCPMPD